MPRKYRKKLKDITRTKLRTERKEETIEKIREKYDKDIKIESPPQIRIGKKKIGVKGERIGEALAILREDGLEINEKNIKNLSRVDFKLKGSDIPLQSVGGLKKRMLRLLREGKLKQV